MLDVNFTINLFWTIFILIGLGIVGWDVYMLYFAEIDDPFSAIFVIFVNIVCFIILAMMLAGKYLF